MKNSTSTNNGGIKVTIIQTSSENEQTKNCLKLATKCVWEFMKDAEEIRITDYPQQKGIDLARNQIGLKKSQ